VVQSGALTRNDIETRIMNTKRYDIIIRLAYRHDTASST
jgi:hypothetical protein